MSAGSTPPGKEIEMSNNDPQPHTHPDLFCKQCGADIANPDAFEVKGMCEICSKEILDEVERVKAEVAKLPISTVYHLKREFYRDSIFCFGDYTPKFPDDYDRVATLPTNDLGIIWRLTNHVDEDWTKGKHVHMHADDARSTSVGDVVVTSDGVVHRCERLGWSVLS